ncbi:MAG: MlaD family protein [Chlorobiota bacterium]|nr:MlaD family protein [Chlorobiota bacterium]
MEELRRLELKVGLLTLGTLLLLLGSITWGRGWQLGVRTQEVVLHFPSGAGIEVGAPVLVNGVQKGSVRYIELRDGIVVLTARLDADVELRRDAHARILLQELTGGRKVELFPGTAAEPLPRRQPIPGATAPDVGELVANLANFGEQLQRLSLRLDTTATALNAVLTPATQRNLTTAIEELTLLAQQLRSLAEGSRASVEESAENIALLSRRLRTLLEQNSPAIDRTLASLERLTRQAETTLGNADSLLVQLQRSSATLEELLSALRSRKTLAGRLLQDEQLALQVDSTVTQLRDFLHQIQRYGVNVNVRLGTRP